MKSKNTPNMKRVIVDFKKLNTNILDLLVTTYPDGYDEDHIITFRNAQNEGIDCVEVRTEDTIYLVKVSKRLVPAMEDHDVEDNDPKTNSLDIDKYIGLEEE